MKVQWKKTIGISPAHETQLRRIKEELDFVNETVTYKFCLTYAITNNLASAPNQQIQRGTKWASGSFDENDEISLLFQAIYPDEPDQQTIMMEKAEAGIERIYTLIDTLGIDTLSGLVDATP